MKKIILALIASVIFLPSLAKSEEHHRPGRPPRAYTPNQFESFRQNQDYDRNRHHHHHGHREHGHFNDLRGYYGPPSPRYVQPGPRYFPPYQPQRSPYGLFLGNGGPVLMYHGANISIIIR
jgi:hypothetical protein